MQNIISRIIIILTSGLLINIIKKEVYQYLNGTNVCWRCTLPRVTMTTYRCKHYPGIVAFHNPFTRDT